MLNARKAPAGRRHMTITSDLNGANDFSGSCSAVKCGKSDAVPVPPAAARPLQPQIGAVTV